MMQQLLPVELQIQILSLLPCEKIAEISSDFKNDIIRRYMLMRFNFKTNENPVYILNKLLNRHLHTMRFKYDEIVEKYNDIKDFIFRNCYGLEIINTKSTSLPELPNCKRLYCYDNKLISLPYLPNCVKLRCEKIY